MMSSSHHIGQGEKRGHQRMVFANWQGNKCAVRLRDADRLPLSIIKLGATPKASVQAGGVQPFLTVDAGSVRPRERRSDKVTDFDFANVAATSLNNTNELVSHSAAA